MPDDPQIRCSDWRLKNVHDNGCDKIYCLLDGTQWHITWTFTTTPATAIINKNTHRMCLQQKNISTKIEESTRNVIKYVDTLRWNEVKNEQWMVRLFWICFVNSLDIKEPISDLTKYRSTAYISQISAFSFFKLFFVTNDMMLLYDIMRCDTDHHWD